MHSTADVDLLPQGVFNDATAWDLDDSVSFSTAPAQHTQAMVADDHLTFMHERPENLVAQTVWATATPTDSNASLGAPDGAYTWSTGPDIDVNGFDVSGLTNYAVRDVTLLLAIEVPGPCIRTKFGFPTKRAACSIWSRRGPTPVGASITWTANPTASASTIQPTGAGVNSPT